MSEFYLLTQRCYLEYDADFEGALFVLFKEIYHLLPTQVSFTEVHGLVRPIQIRLTYVPVRTWWHINMLVGEPVNTFGKSTYKW